MAKKAFQAKRTKLNQAQRKAVEALKGPLLVLAGAGTGKTTVLVEKYKRLMAKGVAPESILVLAFNERAAAELRERLDESLPYGNYDYWIHTFHAFCQRVLRDNAVDAGLPPDFRVMDQTEQWIAVHGIMKEMALGGTLKELAPAGGYRRFVAAVSQHVTRARDEVVEPKRYAAWVKKLKVNGARDPLFKDLNAETAAEKKIIAARYAELSSVYGEYCATLKREGTVDFAGLLSETAALFARRPGIAAAYRAQFSHAFVDEFQDTNPAQYALVKALFPPKTKPNLTVVGDDDQSIYRFRGASVNNILSFKKDYPGAGVVTLKENYRSNAALLGLAHRFISHNESERLHGKKAGGIAIDKELSANKKSKGVAARAAWLPSLEQEIAWIAAEMKSVKEKNPSYSWSSFAVLCRGNDLAERLHDGLRANGVPAHWLSSSGLYHRHVVMDLVAGLRVAADPHDSPALWRVLHWDIGGWRLTPAGVSAIGAAYGKYGTSYWHALRRILDGGEFSKEDERAARKIISVFDALHADARRLPVTELLLKMLRDSGWASRLLEREDGREKREALRLLELLYARLQRFAKGRGGVPTADAFVAEHELELAADDGGALPQDAEDPDGGPDAASVLTVHAAKGLEWPVVFVPGMVNLRFPTSSRGESMPLPAALRAKAKKGTILTDAERHLLEERRLMYVAITRAQDLFRASGAADYGGKTEKAPSSFLEELGIPLEELSVAASSAMESLLATNAIPATPEFNDDAAAVPKNFSYTQLADYQSCPLRYRYAHVWKIPTAGSHAASFGQSLHRTLQAFFTLLPAEPAMGIARLLELYESNWETAWYPDRKTEEFFKRRGRAALRRFLKDFRRSPDETVAVERRFSLDIGGVTVRGSVDRIAAAPGGGWTLYDFKTGAAKELKELRAAKRTDQLLIYQLAALNALGGVPEKLVFYFLESGRQVDFLGTEKELAKLEEKIRGLAERIAARDFVPTPERHACKTCPYSSICPFRAS